MDVGNQFCGYLPSTVDYNIVVLHHPVAVVDASPCRVSRDLSLRMGIHSFIKNRILRRDGDSERNDDSKTTASEDIDLRTVLQNPNSSGLMESPLSSLYEVDDSAGVTPVDGKDVNASTDRMTSEGVSRRKRNKAVDVILTHDMKQRLQEDAKDRIRRVQAGSMTEEENFPLTRTLPPKKPRGPPIRQKIPGLEDEDSDGKAAEKRGSSSSNNKGGGSSKTDNLWSAITRKGTSHIAKSTRGKSDYVPVSSMILDGKLRNEEAKRQWIDSITNPDRFASFSSIQRESTSDEDQSDDDIVDNLTENKFTEVEDEAKAGEQDFNEMKRRITEDQKLLLNKPKTEKPGEKSVREALESILSMASRSNGDTGTTVSSSSNSTQGVKNDDLAARLEKAAVEQENRESENRAAAEKKRMEQQQALLELQKEREANFLRQEAERMEEARKKAEQLRLKEQEKKAAERAKLEAAVAKQDEYWANQLKKQQAKREASMPVQERRRSEERDIIKATESEEMFERDVAKDAKREQIREEERMRESKHEGEILKEAQEEKLRDRELTRDIIDESVAKVSRTVVKPSAGDVSASAFVQEQRKKKEELDRLAEVQRQRLKMLNSPLSTQHNAPTRSSTPRPLPSVKTPPVRPTPKVSPSSRDMTLSSLTMKKNTQPSQVKDTITPKPSMSDSAMSPAKRPLKKPVRQQLPITRQYDNDDEDDDNLMKGGGPGLTVADALNQQRNDGGGDKSSESKKALNAEDRAKQWGIDMSRFK
ncbi:hypothetical protein HJC23_001895 [Cyclotella cryptica]|uniref:Uncharacterized protein n=1 Tax=Cyclotella cryptica TaxID=29204 RepID=A0ABD3NLA5_9STRA